MTFVTNVFCSGSCSFALTQVTQSKKPYPTFIPYLLAKAIVSQPNIKPYHLQAVTFGQYFFMTDTIG